MSLENHPNFHAVLFVTKIYIAYIECMRKSEFKLMPPDISDLVIKFVGNVEDRIDNSIAKLEEIK